MGDRRTRSFTVIKIINEPTAASLTYGFGKPQNNNGGQLLGKNIFFDDFAQSSFRRKFFEEKDKKKRHKIF